MIDLHLHFDGSIPIEVLQNLARRQGLDLSIEQLTRECVAPTNCGDLNRYLRCFDLPIVLLQSEWAIRQAMIGLMTCDKLRGHEYVEIRFAPQLHTRGGMTQEQVVDTTVRAILDNKTPCVYRLILCLMRGGDYQTNLTTLQLAADYRGIVVGVDLAGAESLYPTAKYGELFKVAVANKLNVTIHAGEASGADSVRAAIDMGAKRIGHGIAIATDKELMCMVKQLKIGIEMCPKSNLDTRAIANIGDYPLQLFLQNGLLVTVNTDNLTVSSTDLNNEYSILKSANMITDGDIVTLQNNARAIKFCQ